MPRDGSGTYTLPAGNPVVAGTIIEVDWANPTMSDLAASMTDSLSRTGNGGMLSRLIHTDGALSLPSITFTSDTQAGLFLNGVGDMQAVVALTPVMRWRSVGADVWDVGGAVWRRVLTEGLSTADDITLDDAGLPITATTVQEGFDETFDYLAGTPTFGNVTVGSLVANTGIAVTGISILDNVRVDGDLNLNNTVASRTSTITAQEGAGRRGVHIYGESNTGNGGWISVYGGDDSLEPDTVRLGYGGSVNADIEMNSGFLFVGRGGTAMVMTAAGTAFDEDVDFNDDVNVDGSLTTVGISASNIGTTSIATETLFVQTSATIPGTLDVTGTTTLGEATADDIITNSITEVNFIRFENPATPANTSLIQSFPQPGRQLLRLFGKSSSSDGAALDLFGEDDSGAPGVAQLRAGGVLVLSADSTGVDIPNLTVDDFGGTSRQAQWTPVRINGTVTRALAPQDIGNIVFVSSSVTLTINTVLGFDGAQVTIVTSGAVTLTLAEGAGLALEWKQGGAVSTGNRTVASSSVVTLVRQDTNLWIIYGNGIS